MSDIHGTQDCNRRLSATMRGAVGMRRVVLLVVLALMVWPVVSVLASPGVGRASETVGRSDTAAVVARRQRLAELDVSAAAVKLLAGNVLAGTATVGNVGSVRARSSTADVAWKSAGSGGLVQLGRFTVPALKPSQRHKSDFQVDVPKGASGEYEVSVCTDVLGQIQERTKKNACRDAGVITIPGSGVKASAPTGPEPSLPPPAAPTTPGGTPTPPASNPPDTVIDSGPTSLIGAASVTFTFHGSDTNDTFQCSLDGAPWASCSSPQQYSSLAEGAHTFQVRAVNAAGEVDPTPASASFTVEATPPQTTITSAPSGRVPIGEVSISFASTEAGSSFQCSLDGAAYSSCNSPDVIKDPAAGPHTFSVQATNQVGVKETAAPPSVSWSSVEPQHDLCGTISSNTTIGPDYAGVYTLDNCTLDVPSGVTLTVDPGTIIKASGGSECNVEGCSTTCLYECSISVEGTLDAVGSAEDPITFTSINDNSVGGDTGTGSPAASDWYGLAAEGSGALDIEHATIAYAQEAVQTIYSGAVTLTDDQLNTDQLGLGSPNAVAGSPIKVTNSSIDGGIDINCAPSLTVTGNTVTGGIDNYCDAVGAEVPSVVDIANNHVTIPASASEGSPAIGVAASNLNFTALASNTITASSSSNAVAVDGEVNVSQAMPATSFAWEISGYATVDVPSGVTLTVDPGTIIKASGGSECNVEGCSTTCLYECSISVEGTLDAVGTEAEPITFTSINDNSIGGATGSGTPAAGEWQGIAAEGSGGTLDIQHATIAYAGAAVQTLYSGAVTLNHDLTNGGGVSSPNAGAGSSVTLTNSSIDGGVDVNCAPSLTVTGDTITGGQGIENYCDAVGSAVASVVDIANNHVTIPAGDGNTPAISVAAANLNFTALASNTITAPSEANAVAVNGEVSVSQTMPATRFAWEISGYAAVDVPAGVALTVAPGAVIKSSEGSGNDVKGCGGYACSISVEGTLDAVGSVSEPITFTSINDNTIGGATGSSTPAQGEWQGISVGNEGEVDLAHATIDYAATGLSSTTDKHVTVESDVFAHNDTALDISATVGTNAAIHETWFDENGVALAGSSDWTGVEPMFDGIPIESCRYVPVMYATGNIFGPKGRDEPFISASEKGDIENWQLVPETAEWPEEWTRLVEVGENDRIEWSVLPCQPVDVETGLPSGPPHVVIGIPFELGG